MSQRWEQIEDVLQRALDLPWQERNSFIDETCAGDAELEREARSLVEAHDEAGDFIEQPAMAQEAYVLLGADIGSHIGPYQILECLGSGGMGDVYLAHDTRLDRRVALKILPSYFASDDARLLRFQREARAASALNHPNILTIHEVGEHDGVRFIATEFVQGETLRSLIESRGLSAERVIEITIQIASGLSAAHRAGIIHRDIKPENVMRRDDGLVKILDFGIVKLVEQDQFANSNTNSTGAQTEVGMMLGTVNYMSPEQARALEVDERTDLWSLGVVVYEMLTNRLPFAGETRMDTLVSILEREPQAMSTPEPGTFDAALQEIAGKLLQKDRTRRYSTADELIDELRSTQGLRRANTPAPAKRAAARRSIPARIAVACALLLAFALIGLVVSRRITSRPAAELIVSPPKAYTQMNEAEQLAFIDTQEQRIATMMGDRTVKLNEEALRAIKHQVDWYVIPRKSDVPADHDFRATYIRAQPYVPLIARAFAERKVPVIIGIYLPVIESAYRECYENSWGAKGLFQFLPQTARDYGLSSSEMCEVDKMAPAAAHYIADRMAELGEDSQSVTLVLASYNIGPEWVRDTLRELRGTENFQRNFWTLFSNRQKLDENFRKETAWYVPTFFAAAIIGENPQSFGMSTPPLSTLAK